MYAVFTSYDAMTEINFHKLTLDGAQRLFEEIYGGANQDRFGHGVTSGISSMWLRVVKQSGEVARAVRKERKDLLLRELPQLFCWYCGFCTKLGISLEDAVWHYFPLICPTCYSERCLCGPHKELEQDVRPRQKDPALLTEYGGRNLARRPVSLDGYVSMFDTIYGGHNEAAHMDSVFLHLTEELGEVARLIHFLKRLDAPTRENLIDGEMASELVDVFSWICKLCCRANAEYRGFRSYMMQQAGGPDREDGTSEIWLSSLIQNVYGHGCPECKKMRCSESCPGWTLGDRGNVTFT
jgi:NTP pyrophosphatase (non-canonical NTP hydrolase)